MCITVILLIVMFLLFRVFSFFLKVVYALRPLSIGNAANALAETYKPFVS